MRWPFRLQRLLRLYQPRLFQPQRPRREFLLKTENRTLKTENPPAGCRGPLLPASGGLLRIAGPAGP